jgi:hypothetical protein
VHSLDLLLDEETDARVRRIWAAIADAGLPSQADHHGSSNAPHITVLAAESLRLDGRPLALGLPVPLELTPAVALGHGPRRTVALGVVLTPRLRELHATATHGTTIVGASPLTDPDLWMPHVTLARRVPVDDVDAVLASARMLDTPVDARGVLVRHWDSVARALTRVSAE